MTAIAIVALLIGSPKYDLWIADPSWVREPLARKRVEGTLRGGLRPGDPWIRALTEDGRIFNATPAGFWSEGRFEPLYLSEESPEGVVGLTFLLPDGRFTTGGAAIFNDLQDFSHGVKAGRFYRGDSYEELADECYITAFSPSGQFAGVMSDGRRREENDLGEYGNPCRIVNMRAVPLRFDSMGQPYKRPIPLAINDKGVIIAKWETRRGAPSDISIVWEPNGDYWLTDERFKLEKKTIEFTCLSNDGRFAGSIHETVVLGEKEDEVQHAIVSDGKSYRLLDEAPGVKESEVTLIAGQDYFGWTEDRALITRYRRGCLWRSGKMVLLQTLLAKETDWKIGKVGAVNKRGQIAVWLWKVLEPVGPSSPGRMQHSFGLMTPRR